MRSSWAIPHAQCWRAFAPSNRHACTVVTSVAIRACCAAQRMLCRSDVLTVRSGLLTPIAADERGPESERGAAGTRQVHTRLVRGCAPACDPADAQDSAVEPPGAKARAVRSWEDESGQRGAGEAELSAWAGDAQPRVQHRPCAAAAFAAKPHLGFAHVGGLLRTSRDRRTAMLPRVSPLAKHRSL